MNRHEIIKRAAKKAGLNRSTMKIALDSLTETIIDAVASGEKVKIMGFGVFEPVLRKPKLARNPRTGEEITVEARRVPVFKVGKEFRDAVRD